MKKIEWKKVIPYAAAILIFLGVSLAYFSPVLDGKKLNQSDILNYKGSAKEVTDFRDATGEEALWTNSMFGGMPAYQISVYYTTNVVPFFNSIFKLGLPHPANILFVLLIGFFILLVVLKIDPWLAIAGAFAFAFSTYVFLILEVGHNAKALAIGYMPAVLAGVILAYRGKYLLGAAVTALFMALEITVNHVQMTYYLLFIIAAYVIAELIHGLVKKQFAHFAKATGVIIIAGIISIGPNITSLWTSYEYMKATIRGKSELTTDQSNKSGGLDKDYITQWSYGTGETFTLLIPDAKGGASGRLSENKGAMDVVDKRMREAVGSQNHYWGNLIFTGGPVYVGAFVVFLFILGLFLVKGRLKWALLGVTVLSILLAWGHNFSILTNFFIDYFPFYNKFRAVSSMLVIAQLTIPLLGILALKEILEKPSLVKEKKLFFFISLGMTAGLLLILWIMPGVFFNFFSIQELQSFDEYRKQGATAAQIDQIMSGIESARLHIFKMSALRSLLFILIGAGLVWLFASIKKMNRYILIAGVALVFLIDLIPINKRYLNNKDFVSDRQSESIFTPSKADEYILKDKDPDFRVLNLAAGNFTLEALTSYYHKSIGGYHAAKLRRYQELIEHRLVQEHDRLIRVLNSNPPDSVLIATMYGLTSLNMLNTRYYIYNPEAIPMRNPAALGNAWFVKKIRIVEDADAEIKELNNFYPATTAIVDKRYESMLGGIAEIKSTGNASINLVSYAPNHLVYETKEVKEKMLAVFSEIYYDKGWNVYVDGSPGEYFRVNYVLRGMIVPEGDHKIEFRFEPESYYTGTKISLAGSVLLVLLMGGALFFELRKPRKKKESK